MLGVSCDFLAAGLRFCSLLCGTGPLAMPPSPASCSLNSSAPGQTDQRLEEERGTGSFPGAWVPIGIPWQLVFTLRAMVVPQLRPAFPQHLHTSLIAALQRQQRQPEQPSSAPSSWDICPSVSAFSSEGNPSPGANSHPSLCSLSPCGESCFLQLESP